MAAPGERPPRRALGEPEDLELRTEPRLQRVASSPRGMVATAHYRATEAGAAALAEGGNAVDAAVAAAFALGVCEPAASGLGGQTMGLVYLAGEDRLIALDGSSRAPNRVVPGSLEREEQLVGYRATTVPSTPAVLDYLRERYGRLDLSAVLRPAIALAEKGYRVSRLQNALTRRELARLRGGTAAPFFLRGGSRPYPVGAVFRQPTLAGTLRRLSRAGADDFYTGWIAERIAEDMARHDGLLHADDLARVPRPIERAPVEAVFEGCRVFTFPPPGAGRTLVQMLNMVSNFPERHRIPDTPEGALLLAATIRKAFTDRSDLPVDPNFYAQVMAECNMLSEEYGEAEARRIRRTVAEVLQGEGATHGGEAQTGEVPVPPGSAGVEIPAPRNAPEDGDPLREPPASSGETTHLSVMDGEGNAVALTQSIERVYGSFSATADLGFLYNNYMSAFEYEDIGHPYYLCPNAVPWASVAPTIVFREGEPWLALGSPGSERISPAILQVLLRLDEQDPYEAVEAPRLFCSVDGVVSLELGRMRSDIAEALECQGFSIRERDPYSFFMGCVQLVMRRDGRVIGVADPRRDGAAAGPGMAAARFPSGAPRGGPRAGSSGSGPKASSR